ncbi:hypothetical protein ZIOFF_048549 [Zingiber officinale]|uniref:Uncharacterized protein n=1 Tax=Zingiber officinale TaxID=94328 RepID=A0A8J5G009_ZINOF|nr:hypothetical protein ZIOFF_048549 [Zingiber officinale]
MHWRRKLRWNMLCKSIEAMPHEQLKENLGTEPCVFICRELAVVIAVDERMPTIRKKTTRDGEDELFFIFVHELFSCLPRHRLRPPNNRAAAASLAAFAPLSKPFRKRRRLYCAVLKDDAPPEEIPRQSPGEGVRAAIEERPGAFSASLSSSG